MELSLGVSGLTGTTQDCGSGKVDPRPRGRDRGDEKYGDHPGGQGTELEEKKKGWI